jgi:hypothetical protein
VADSSFRNEVQNVEPGALIIGNQVFVQALSASGRMFVFTRKQIQFLWALQKMKNVDAAAISINEEPDWATRFMASRKFKDYVVHKMEEMSVRNGLTVEWWYQFGKTLTEGKEVWYEGECEHCHESVKMLPYEAESCRDDDGSFNPLCRKCSAPLTLTEKEEEFKPTREQVEGWKELGSRLIPKIERVHHQFENVEIEFQSTEESHG